MRLGQLILNATDSPATLFYIEDDALLDALEKFVKEQRERRNKKHHAEG